MYSICPYSFTESRSLSEMFYVVKQLSLKHTAIVLPYYIYMYFLKGVYCSNLYCLQPSVAAPLT